MERLRVGVVFGGRSVEHDVSIVTAHQAMAALEPSHDVIPIYITREGHWLSSPGLNDLSVYKDKRWDEVGRPCHIPPVPGKGLVIEGGQSGGLLRKGQPNETIRLDVVIPAVHGTFGEDGTLQGLLEMAGLAYAGLVAAGNSVVVFDKAGRVGGAFRLAGLAPTGTMPHALVLIFGDTVRAAEAFDRHIDPEVPRIVLVDTFKDEAEEALRVASALGERLYGIRLDTPAERGRVTPALVQEVRARLDQAGFGHVRIIGSGGLTPERIGVFQEAGAPVDSYAVGSFISGAQPVDFTGDLKEIDGRPVAKRGRIPGRTENPRLERIDLRA